MYILQCFVPDYYNLEVLHGQTSTSSLLDIGTIHLEAILLHVPFSLYFIGSIHMFVYSYLLSLCRRNNFSSIESCIVLFSV